MKKVLKISLILISIIILNMLLIINSVNAVSLGKINITSGGDCGRLLKYRGIEVIVYYAQYESNGVIYPAYCLDKTKQGVTDNIQYSVSVNEAIKDVGLWRYIINGYPYKTIEELGCANKEEAFTATKQAIYCYIHGNNPADYEPIGEAGQRTLNALKMIVNNANNSTENMISNKITIEKLDTSFKQDSKEPEYISKSYKISSLGEIENYKITIEKNNNELIEGMKITDSNNKIKNEFNPNENFKILIPIKYLNQKGDFKIHIQTRVKTKPVLYGMAETSGYQDYALTAATYEDSIEDITDEYSENETKIKIIKYDKETKETLSNVEFQLLNSNQEIIFANLLTDENGEILIEHLLPGTYYLKETKVLDGYIENNELIKVDVGYNETVTVKVNNLQEDEPEEEIPPEKEISNSVIEKDVEKEAKEEIKKLPVTGM